MGFCRSGVFGNGFLGLSKYYMYVYIYICMDVALGGVYKGMDPASPNPSGFPTKRGNHTPKGSTGTLCRQMNVPRYTSRICAASAPLVFHTLRNLSHWPGRTARSPRWYTCMAHPRHILAFHTGVFSFLDVPSSCLVIHLDAIFL